MTAAAPGAGGRPAAASRLLAPAALTAAVVLSLDALLVPWYALGEYRPTGWEATWWARLAVPCALAVMLLVRTGRRGRAAFALSALAAGAVAFRLALPPDFGFDFAGLDVPVERLAGPWIGLAAALVMVAATRPDARRRDAPGAVSR